MNTLNSIPVVQFNTCCNDPCFGKCSKLHGACYTYSNFLVWGVKRESRLVLMIICFLLSQSNYVADRKEVRLFNSSTPCWSFWICIFHLNHLIKNVVPTIHDSATDISRSVQWHLELTHRIRHCLAFHLSRKCTKCFHSFKAEPFCHKTGQQWLEYVGRSQDRKVSCKRNRKIESWKRTGELSEWNRVRNGVESKEW